MSSAIEDLTTIETIKQMLNPKLKDVYGCIQLEYERRALKEALLALEQKEKLVEWLEKEIKENENWLNTTNDCLMPSEEEALEAEYKIKFCKEVLGRVGEQK